MADAQNPKWPAHDTADWPIEQLIPYARNPRMHTPEQVASIAKAIAHFGFTNRVLIDEGGNIIAGHGRVMAAEKLNLKTVPVMVARGWSEADRRAYVIWDNKSAEASAWDNDLLKGELIDLGQMDYDLVLTGFPQVELNTFLSGLGTGQQPGDAHKTLAERFGIPPFSVLNARGGWWQNRKSSWIALGIRSEVGRGAAIAGAPMPIDRAKKAETEGRSQKARWRRRVRMHGRSDRI